MTEKVNESLVQAMVTLMKSLTEKEREAILSRFDQYRKPPSLAGLVGTRKPAIPRGELVDYCKRIEFCYKEYPGHTKRPFMPFQVTEAFIQEIAEREGMQLLKEYVEAMENAYKQGWTGFSRPERMKAQFLAWRDQKSSQTRPDQ